MAKVLTLDGLKTAETDRAYTKCTETVLVHSPTLGKDVEVCKEDLSRVAAEVEPPKMKRRRGRPKGSTVKAGAKKPKVSSCTSPKWVTKGKRSYCRCGDKGNSQILPHTACGRKRKPKKKE